MVRRSMTLVTLTAVVLMLYAVVWQHLDTRRQVFLDEHDMDYTLPSRFTGPAALEFKGILSDFLFLKVITFLGDKIGKHDRFDDTHADYLSASIDSITDLDPYFWDAYLFADMMLTWQMGKFQMANELLFKARQHRTQDYRVPYFIGFNYFYFMGNNAKGAQYLMEAAKLPGSPNYLPNLAARLSVYSFQHRTAIAFLKKMLDDTQNEALANQLTMRIKALIALDKLEQGVAQYRKKFNRMPSSLNELLIAGIIEEMPEDPYGGQFVLLKNARVYTTSRMVVNHK